VDNYSASPKSVTLEDFALPHQFNFIIAGQDIGPQKLNFTNYSVEQDMTRFFCITRNPPIEQLESNEGVN